jgi:hypothetical protein
MVLCEPILDNARILISTSDDDPSARYQGHESVSRATNPNNALVDQRDIIAYC